MRTVWTMGFVAAAALAFCFPDYIVFRFTQAVIWSIALLGMVILCGISGQFSFAQAALYGLGGYTIAILGTHTPLPLYWAFLLAPVLGFAVGYGLGRVAGSHSLWTQALINYALVIAFPQMLRWRPVEGFTGGVQGLYVDLPEESAGIGISADRWIFLLSLGLLALGVVLAKNLTASRSGRALEAARDHDLAAAAQGIDVAHFRAMASGLAGGYLAIAGCLAALQLGFVGPGSYGFALSVQMLFGLVIGGMNSIAGAIVGGLFMEFFPGLVASLGQGLSAVLFALLLIAAIVAVPNGVVGGVAGALPRFAARMRRLFSGP
jgi:branched-chain amino acid transport system permease protein